MSQKPIYIAGSLIRQLALQKPEAFDKCKEFYLKHHPHGRPPSVPSVLDLMNLLRSTSMDFEEVSIILDGLDECGANAGVDRSELLRVLAILNHASGRIRLAIASRQEHDIKQCLESFDRISIAAMSSDLELYVAAEVSRRLGARIRDEALQHEIIEALVTGAEGMFQWVKCQLDYLIRLPNDSERRKALKQLPPDLPATYIRIFERICRDYPPQTQEFVRRIFEWLTIGVSDFKSCANENLLPCSRFTLRALAIAITIDVAGGHLNESEMPRIDDVCEWCGSLIQVEDEDAALSHFTVKEFLTSTIDAVQSDDILKFFVNERETQPYLASASLIYISHPKLPKAYSLDPGRIDEFTSKFPFYENAAVLFLHYLSSTELDFEEIACSRRFFTSELNVYIILWLQFLLHCASYDNAYGNSCRHPLHLAAHYGRYKTCQRLLSEGVDVNVRSSDGILPIDFALAEKSYFPSCSDIIAINKESPLSDEKLDVSNLLIQAGANINHTIDKVLEGVPSIDYYELDLLTIALLSCEPILCKLLLENGVAVNVNNVLEFIDESPGWIFESIETEETHLVYANFVHAIKIILKYVQNSEVQKRYKDHLILLDSLASSRQSKEKNGYSTGEELFAAIDCQNELALDLILEEADSFEFVDEHGRIPLEAAIDGGKKSFVAKLVRAGADIHRSDSCGRTPLEYAYRTWDAAIVREVFELDDDHIDNDDIGNHDDDMIDEEAKGDDISEDQLGLTWSEYRSFIRDPPDLNREYVMQGIVKGLRKEHIADFSTPEELTALTLCERDNVIQFTVDTESEHMLALLLSSSWGTSDGTLPRLGTEIFDTIYLESTILHYAVRTGKIRAVQAILRSDLCASLVGCVDHWGKTALHSAVEGGKLVVLNSLLACGANITAKDFDGRTPLHIAILVQTSLDVVKQLIDSGADVNVRDQNGWSPLTLAAYLTNLPLLKEVANAAADLNIRGPRYWCPLRIAIERGGQDVVEYLVRAGADIEVKDEGGRTPLMSAVRRKHLHQAEALVEANTNINAQDHAAWCPLTVAIIMGSRTIVVYLLSHGANVNLKGREGCTALHMSARMHQLDIVGELLHSGADLGAVNDDGETPLQFARQGGSLPATSEILLGGSAVHAAGIAGSKLALRIRND